MKKTTTFFWIGILALVLIFTASEFLFKRFDATADQRYTLTETSKRIIENISEPLDIEVLLAGDLTGNYRVLKNEISFLLQELQSLNPNINFSFVNPIENYSEQELIDQGLLPVPIKTEKGILNIFPYARLDYKTKNDSIKTKEFWMPTIIEDPTINYEDLPLATTEKLEYIFLKNIQKLTREERKNVGILVHHDELPEKNLRSFGRALSDKYNVEIYLEPIQDSTYQLKYQDFENLKKYDAIIVAKPTLPFSDSDKLVMDQYIMNGGKTMWMLETVDAEMDSIFRSESILAFPRQLNLNDFFFSYGARIIPTVIKDLEGGKIVLADGETAGNVNYNYYTWPYFIQASAAQEHPINQSLTAVRMEFANPIEILENPNVTATVLLSSSAKTNFKSPLTRIKIEEVDTQNPEQYNAGYIPTAVLLEGNFQSAYANRFESKEFPNFKSSTVDGKMILISDGDVAKNHLWLGKTMQLGEDKYTMRPDNPNQKPITYDNQSFLINCLDYLMGENDFLFLRNRQLEIPVLDENVVKQKKSFWQSVNLLFPVALITLLGVFSIYLKRKKFAK